MLRRVLMLIAVGLATIGASPAKPMHDWVSTVASTPEGGHRIGNPAAAIKLIAFVSYTCPHCAHFEAQSDAALRLSYVASGTTSYEVRNFVRDPVDLTAAVLANCGSAAKFMGNNSAFFRSQDKWFAKAQAASPAQRQRWGNGTYALRRHYIATDLGFITLMEERGYTRPEIDKCLADDALATRLAQRTQSDGEAFDIEGTPSFAINGARLTGTYTWEALEPQLKARL